MPEIHPSFLGLLDHVVGLADEWQAHLKGCATCKRRSRGVRALIDYGRNVRAAPTPSRAQVRSAMRIFREAKSSWTRILRIVLDSVLGEPVPALRDKGERPRRFLRLEGVVSVDLEITGGARATVHGSIHPVPDGPVVLATAGKEIALAVDRSGAFVARNVPGGEYVLRVAGVSSETLSL